MADEKDVCKFFLEGRCCFGDRCRYSHTDEKTSIVTEVSNKPRKSTKHSNRNQGKEKSTKLPPMKTSRDVIARLQWDDELPSQHFIIGYLDRFVGVIEQPFHAFDWTSDLASVDQNVLAIPQHRIQYFKYRGHKLWDKNERLDLIFGSTGSSVSIPEILKSIDEQLLFQKDLVLDNLQIDQRSEIFDNPTHIIAIHINTDKLLASIQDSLNQLLKDDSVVTVPPNLYHTTLCTLRLETIEQVSHCKNLLNSITQEFFVDPPTFIQITGFGNYGNRVFFAKLASDQQFNNTVMSLLSFLRVNGVCVSNLPEMFHVTLLKGHNCLENIDEDKLVELKNTELGNQFVDSVHLCSLHEVPDVETKFYGTVTSVYIARSEVE